MSGGSHTGSDDPFVADEAGDSRPREFYDIVQSAAITYHVASGQRDIVWNGVTYTASPLSRSEVGISAVSGDFSVTFSLSMDHPLCQRYMALVSPPGLVSVTIWRKQLNSGLVEQIWSGDITSIAFDSEDHVAKFTIPSRMSRTLTRTLPLIMVSRLCPHVLYDPQCTINPAGFSTATTIANINGNVVTVNTTFGPSDFTVGGDLQHVKTGEIQTVVTQGPNVSGTVVLTLQAPIPDMQSGDAVVVRAGCDHTMGTCAVKFSNNQNYGGFPDIPDANPFIPAGLGVLTNH